jgi:hypothetical protein
VSRRAAIILAATLVAILVAMGVGAVVLVRGARTPAVHLIPDGYTGWVEAAYGVAGAPPLPVEDGKRILRYDGSGRLETSSEFEEGWGVDSYYYVAGDERRLLRQRPPGFDGEIWHVYTGTSLVIRTAEGETIRRGVHTGFFVGTEEQLRADPGQ